MSGVKVTGKQQDIAVGTNQTRIWVSRKNNPYNHYMDWKNKSEVPFESWEIKETDMRVKTASFTSRNYLDLTTGVYCVIITGKNHENFAGVILTVEREDNGLYTYQCQDFSRYYMSKSELICNNISLHRILKHLITRGGVSLTGDVTQALKNYKVNLSGLRPAYQYDQEVWGGLKNFNPMNTKLTIISRDKSDIELIRDLIYGCGAYIDVYCNQYGTIQIEPYHKNEWLKPSFKLDLNQIEDIDVKFDTTNIITGVNVTGDGLKIGSGFNSKSLTGLDLSAFFGTMVTNISNPNNTSSSSSKSSTKTKTTSKKASSTKTTSNPYKTKSKTIYINSDNIRGRSQDKKFMNDIASLLKKQGWKTKIIGLGPNTHTEKYMKGCKNGVWFCIYGGADGAVFKECAGKNSYTNTLKKNNLRTVIGMRQGCDIRKGGKCYKWLQRAHDDNYSPSSYKGISYPLNMLTKAKVPIMYAGTAKNMVAKFLKGGDNPKAC